MARTGRTAPPTRTARTTCTTRTPARDDGMHGMRGTHIKDVRATARLPGMSLDRVHETLYLDNIEEYGLQDVVGHDGYMDYNTTTRPTRRVHGPPQRGKSSRRRRPTQARGRAGSKSACRLFSRAFFSFSFRSLVKVKGHAPFECFDTLPCPLLLA